MDAAYAPYVVNALLALALGLHWWGALSRRRRDAERMASLERRIREVDVRVTHLSKMR